MFFIYLIIFATGVSSSCIRKTVPLTNEELNSLVNNLPVYEDNDECLTSEECAKNWISIVNRLNDKINEAYALLYYNSATNITEQNDQFLVDFSPISDKFARKVFQTSKKFYAQSNGWNDELRRMLYFSTTFVAGNTNVTIIQNELSNIYSTNYVVKDNKKYYLDPELTNILSSSRDYDELLWAWSSWYNTVGPKLKNTYKESVELVNNAAQQSGYNDLSVLWINELETDNLEQVCDDIFNQVKPLYEELHAYVRRKLRDLYGDNKVNSRFIPAHLLGNMWAQTWDNLYDILVPYNDIPLLNLDNAFVQNNYTVMKLFKQSEEFYTSIGFYPMTDTFWKYSMIEKPTDNRLVSCHGTAWEFSNGFDYRISMCTQLNQEDFYTVHHEMGHIEYYMSYSNQPSLFKGGANSAFHEAVGDTIALSVNNPTHYKAIGLLKDFDPTNEFQINTLLKNALSKISFLPFGLLVDKWRWNVFQGKITPDNYNEKWWELVNKYQGVESAIPRNESNFDPGSKYHIPNYVPYIRYFIAQILQFQFYEAMCNLSGHEGPLNLCDFYGSKEAGLKLKEMLSLGSSKHWTVALKTLTGKDYYDASSILKYYEPLYEWLKLENSKYPNDPVGW